MRILRNLAVAFMLLVASTTFAASTTANQSPQFDGGEPPPMCVPGDPNCPK